MDKTIVIIFNDESMANSGSKGLQKLHDGGIINIYSMAVVARDANGMLEIRLSENMDAVGTIVALDYFLDHAWVGEDFVYDVGKSLQPGRYAVVADVWEERVMPVDAAMEPYGGVVFRRVHADIMEADIERDLIAVKAELVELKDERSQTSGEDKAKLQAKIDASAAKLETMNDGIQNRIDASQQEAEAKIKSLREQTAKAHGDRKAKLEAHRAEVQAKHEARRAKLEQARKLIKEALVP